MNEKTHDTILLGIMFFMLASGYLFTIKGTRIREWFQKITGCSDKGMGIIHHASLWGGIISFIFFALSLLMKN